MPIATWKDLCIDAVDARLLGRFWADTLGLTYESLADGDARLTGPTPQHTIWINSVPEPVTVKQRVHLDVHASSVEEVLDLGATAAESHGRWTIVRDPEGGELCVFPREPDDPRLAPGLRLYEFGIDCGTAWRETAPWWGEVLGATYGADEDQGWAWAEDIPGAPFECFVFVPVPEPKTVKNRIHWDVTADVDDLLAAGAELVERMPSWTVMADPEGNEFCCFAPED